MFMYGEDDPGGAILIPQASHSWLAWQLAEHWGNRRFARPAPRAEVLAAVMLHDSGWNDFDAAPRIGASGRPLTFNNMPVADHVDIWRSCIARVALLNRYSALLVASHFAGMAEMKTASLLEKGDTAGARHAEAFRAEIERQQAAWRENLALDSRYRAYIEDRGWAANLHLLTACDRVSVHLCASLGRSFTVAAQVPSGDVESVEFTATGERTWRVSPWPMQGDRLRLQCEGRRIRDTVFKSVEDLRTDVCRAPVTRLAFTLTRPSAK